MGSKSKSTETAKRAGDKGDPVVSNKTDTLKNGGQDQDPRQQDRELGRSQPAGHQPVGEPAGEHDNDSNTDLVSDQKRGEVRTHAPMNPGELDKDAHHGKTQDGHLQNRNGDWQHPEHAGQATMLETGSDAQYRLQQAIRDGDTRIRCEREGRPVPDDVKERLAKSDTLNPLVDSAGNQDVDPVTRNYAVRPEDRNAILEAHGKPTAPEAGEGSTATNGSVDQVEADAVNNTDGIRNNPDR
jgi:hypothetical protein